jgi:membrane associated rhomboid family serine protease
MFHQLLTPVGDSLALSFVIAALPVLAVLLMLGALQRPAWQASLAGLVVGLILAVTTWHGAERDAGGHDIRRMAGDVDRVCGPAAL